MHLLLCRCAEHDLNVPPSCSASPSVGFSLDCTYCTPVIPSSNSVDSSILQSSWFVPVFGYSSTVASINRLFRCRVVLLDVPSSSGVFIGVSPLFLPSYLGFIFHSLLTYPWVVHLRRMFVLQTTYGKYYLVQYYSTGARRYSSIILYSSTYCL